MLRNFWPEAKAEGQNPHKSRRKEKHKQLHERDAPSAACTSIKPPETVIVMRVAPSIGLCFVLCIPGPVATSCVSLTWPSLKPFDVTLKRAFSMAPPAGPWNATDVSYSIRSPISLGQFAA